MADLNRYIATGRLTADAEFRTTPNGKNVLSCNVAVNYGYGQYKKTLFVKVQQWGESGQNVVGYLKKGTLITIDGEPSINEWQSKDGTYHCGLTVDVRSIQILASKKQEDNKPVEEASEEDSAVF